MSISISTVNKRIAPEGYSVREGYQRFRRRGWGFRKDSTGQKIKGYEVYDYSVGCVIFPRHDMWDHAATYDEAISFIRGILPDCI